MKRSRVNLLLDVLSLLLFLALIETGLILKYVLPPGSGRHGGGGAAALLGWVRHDWIDVHFWLSVGMVALMLVHVALHWRWACCIMSQLVGRGATTDNGPIAQGQGTAYGAGFLLAVLLVTGGVFWWSWQSVGGRGGMAGEPRGRGWRGGRTAVASLIADGSAAGGADRQQFCERCPAEKAGRGEVAVSQRLADRPSGCGRNAPEPGRGGQQCSRRDCSGTASSPYAESSASAASQPHRPTSGAVQIRGSMTLQEVERNTGVSAAAIINALGLPANTPASERLGRLRQAHGFEIGQVRDLVDKRRAQ